MNLNLEKSFAIHPVIKTPSIEVTDTKKTGDFNRMWGEKAISNCKQCLDLNLEEDVVFFNNYIKFGYYATLFIYKRYHPQTPEVKETMESFFEWANRFVENISQIHNEKVKKQLFKKVRDFINDFMGFKTYPLPRDEDSEMEYFFRRYVYLACRRGTFLELVETLSPALLAELALVPSLDEDELEQYSQLNFESLSLNNSEDLIEFEKRSHGIRNVLKSNWQSKSDTVLLSHLNTIESDIQSKNEKAKYYLLESVANKIIGFVRFEELEPGFVKGGMFNVDENNYGGLNVAMKILRETLVREMKSDIVVGTGGVNDIITQKYIESFDGMALKKTSLMGLDLLEVLFSDEINQSFNSKRLSKEEIMNLDTNEKTDLFSKKVRSLTDISIPDGYALTRCIRSSGNNMIMVVYEKIPQQYVYLVHKADLLLTKSTS